MALIKPQFEAGREEVGKKGVVRDPDIHFKVISETIDFAYALGFSVDKLDFSPIKGPEGNIEYLVLLSKNESLQNKVDCDTIKNIVDKSHEMD